MSVICPFNDRDMVCQRGSDIIPRGQPFGGLSITDTVFILFCDRINDWVKEIRAQALERLGAFRNVSPFILMQTLNKERAEAPSDLEIPLAVAHSSCGAFVQGLEDEFEEVRTASVDALCELGSVSLPAFARSCVELLVDMSNDEMESVRLNAVRSVRKIASTRPVVLDEIQLHIILAALEDANHVMREGYYRLLSVATVETHNSFSNMIHRLIFNLRKFKHDTALIFHTLRDIGYRHPDLVESWAPRVLKLDTRFLPQESSLESKTHVAAMILVFNAVVRKPSILQILPAYTFRHFQFLHSKDPTNFFLSSSNSASTASAGYGDALFFVNGVIADINKLCESREFPKARLLLLRLSRDMSQRCQYGSDDTAKFILYLLRAFQQVVLIKERMLTLLWDSSREEAEIIKLTYTIESCFQGLPFSFNRVLRELRVIAHASAHVSLSFDLDLSGLYTRLEILRRENADSYLPESPFAGLSKSLPSAASSSEKTAVLINLLQRFSLPSLPTSSVVRRMRGSVTVTDAKNVASLQSMKRIPYPLNLSGEVMYPSNEIGCEVEVCRPHVSPLKSWAL
ncbi:hypothetical protein DFJ73DRAFT_849765 [Zopfochytrium polystomum]|nr:hypothetical protein DFJ73DRAFT_849765 [Zopfochytrium polystomum]